MPDQIENASPLADEVDRNALELRPDPAARSEAPARTNMDNAKDLIADGMPRRPPLHTIVEAQLAAAPSEQLRVRIRRAWGAATGAIAELRAVGLAFALTIEDKAVDVLEYPKQIRLGSGSGDFVIVYSKEEEQKVLEDATGEKHEDGPGPDEIPAQQLGPTGSPESAEAKAPIAGAGPSAARPLLDPVRSSNPFPAPGQPRPAGAPLPKKDLA